MVLLLPDIEEAALWLRFVLPAQALSKHQYRLNADSLSDAYERAVIFAHSLIATPLPVDWRSWVLHASDDLGEEIFALPFSSIIGRPH